MRAGRQTLNTVSDDRVYCFLADGDHPFDAARASACGLAMVTELPIVMFKNMASSFRDVNISSDAACDMVQATALQLELAKMYNEEERIDRCSTLQLFVEELAGSRRDDDRPITNDIVGYRIWTVCTANRPTRINNATSEVRKEPDPSVQDTGDQKSSSSSSSHRRRARNAPDSGVQDTGDQKSSSSSHRRRARNVSDSGVEDNDDDADDDDQPAPPSEKPAPRPKRVPEYYDPLMYVAALIRRNAATQRQRQRRRRSNTVTVRCPSIQIRRAVSSSSSTAAQMNDARELFDRLVHPSWLGSVDNWVDVARKRAISKTKTSDFDFKGGTRLYHIKKDQQHPMHPIRVFSFQSSCQRLCHYATPAGDTVHPDQLNPELYFRPHSELLQVLKHGKDDDDDDDDTTEYLVFPFPERVYRLSQLEMLDPALFFSMIFPGNSLVKSMAESKRLIKDDPVWAQLNALCPKTDRGHDDDDGDGDDESMDEDRYKPSGLRSSRLWWVPTWDERYLRLKSRITSTRPDAVRRGRLREWFVSFMPDFKTLICGAGAPPAFEDLYRELCRLKETKAISFCQQPRFETKNLTPFGADIAEFTSMLRHLFFLHDRHSVAFVLFVGTLDCYDPNPRDHIHQMLDGRTAAGKSFLVLLLKQFLVGSRVISTVTPGAFGKVGGVDTRFMTTIFEEFPDKWLKESKNVTDCLDMFKNWMTAGESTHESCVFGDDGERKLVEYSAQYGTLCGCTNALKHELLPEIRGRLLWSHWGRCQSAEPLQDVMAQRKRRELKPWTRERQQRFIDRMHRDVVMHWLCSLMLDLGLKTISTELTDLAGRRIQNEYKRHGLELDSGRAINRLQKMERTLIKWDAIRDYFDRCDYSPHVSGEFEIEDLYNVEFVGAAEVSAVAAAMFRLQESDEVLEDLRRHFFCSEAIRLHEAKQHQRTPLVFGTVAVEPTYVSSSSSSSSSSSRPLSTSRQTTMNEYVSLDPKVPIDRKERETWRDNWTKELKQICAHFDGARQLPSPMSWPDKEFYVPFLGVHIPMDGSSDNQKVFNALRSISDTIRSLTGTKNTRDDDRRVFALLKDLRRTSKTVEGAHRALPCIRLEENAIFILKDVLLQDIHVTEDCIVRGVADLHPSDRSMVIPVSCADYPFLNRTIGGPEPKPPSSSSSSSSSSSKRSRPCTNDDDGNQGGGPHRPAKRSKRNGCSISSQEQVVMEGIVASTDGDAMTDDEDEDEDGDDEHAIRRAFERYFIENGLQDTSQPMVEFRRRMGTSTSEDRDPSGYRMPSRSDLDNKLVYPDDFLARYREKVAATAAPTATVST